jgi:hypothetical protein
MEKPQRPESSVEHKPISKLKHWAVVRGAVQRIEPTRL